MKRYTVTFEVEADMGGEAVEETLRAALDGIPPAPYIDYCDLVVGDADGTTIAPEPAYDFSLTDQGTILVLSALTDDARAWVGENVGTEGYQPDLPNRVYLEPRYVDALLDGIGEAGLTVDAIEQALAGGGIGTD